MSPKSGIRQKEIRKISKQPTYHATIVLKENTIPGANISTMSLKCAKSIQFLPTNTKKKKTLCKPVNEWSANALACIYTCQVFI